jgi:hypothetical protein
MDKRKKRYGPVIRHLKRILKRKRNASLNETPPPVPPYTPSTAIGRKEGQSPGVAKRVSAM